MTREAAVAEVEEAVVVVEPEAHRAMPVAEDERRPAAPSAAHQPRAGRDNLRKDAAPYTLPRPGHRIARLLPANNLHTSIARRRSPILKRSSGEDQRHVHRELSHARSAR